MSMFESEQAIEQLSQDICPLCKNVATSVETEERKRIPINSEECCFKREVKVMHKCNNPNCNNQWSNWSPIDEYFHNHNMEMISFNGKVVVQRCSNIIQGTQCPRTTVINLKRPIF